jgi:hypothetical protein
MTIRLFGALLCGAALILATQTDLAQAQSRAVGGGERMGGGGGKGTPRLKVEFQDITITGYRTKNGGIGGTSRGDKRNYPYGKQQHR